jgi:hypothetical protein
MMIRYIAPMIDDDLPWEPPPAGDEVATLLGSLERQRSTFRWKCTGLDEAGMSARLSSSAMTLGGLVKHMALVEQWTFGMKLLGEPLGPPFDAYDFDEDPDVEWRTAADDQPAELLELWEESTALSRRRVASVLDDGGLGALGRPWPDGRAPSLRRLLIDMIEEYARHTGHADVLREAVDGLVGEDPPRP